MFNFFKNKNNKKSDDDDRETCEAELVSEDDEEENDDSALIASGVAVDASVRYSTKQAKIKFTRPDYNPQTRKAYYDDPKAHKNAIDKAFSSGGSAKDPYTGAELLKKQRDAKMKYGADWQNHAAEADHSEPLNQLYKRTSKNPFLTTEDLKEIGNSDDNFQVIARKLNQGNKDVGKGGSTQGEWADDPARMKGLADNLENGRSIDSVSKSIREKGASAEKANTRKIFKRSIKNAALTAHEAGTAGAKSAGVTTATMSGIMNIVAVINGEKKPEDAVADTLVDTGKAAVTGYIMSGGLTTLYQTLSMSSSKFIEALTSSNVPGKVITAVTVTGDTLKRYFNGEISTQQCLISLGEKGLGLATAGYSSAIGQALIPIPVVGAAVGALVGSMLTSNYYNQLIDTLKTKELEHQERLRIIEECERAAQEARRFREEMEVYLQSYFKDYQNCFDDALSVIDTSFRSGNADGIIEGANQITRKLGGKVYYNNVEEFKDYLFDNSTDIL